MQYPLHYSISPATGHSTVEIHRSMRILRGWRKLHYGLMRDWCQEFGKRGTDVCDKGEGSGKEAVASDNVV